MAVQRDPGSAEPRPWVNGQLANGRRFIPNVVVETHTGERKLFYDELVRDRTVIIQFTSIASHQDYPVTMNLKNVQRLLGPRCGRDVSLYTVTSTPEVDTPERFSGFSQQFAPGTGWTFLSGEPAAIEAIKRVFFVNAVGSRPGAHADHRDCSMGLMRYGNDAAGLWGSVPTKLDPELIIQRVQWLHPSPTRSSLTRKGPRAIA